MKVENRAKAERLGTTQAAAQSRTGSLKPNLSDNEPLPRDWFPNPLSRACGVGRTFDNKIGESFGVPNRKRKKPAIATFQGSKCLAEKSWAHLCGNLWLLHGVLGLAFGQVGGSVGTRSAVLLDITWARKSAITKA